jgi:protein O-mannosyl-transferase
MNPFLARRGTFFSLSLIAVVCLIAYSNTFHVPFQFDDPSSISWKPYVKDINAFFGAQVETDSSFIMRTLTYFTFAVNYRLHGNEVVGYHAVNLAIHLLNGFLVYFLVLLTFRTPYFATANVSFQHSLFPLVGDCGTSSEEGLRTSRSDKQCFIALFVALLFVSHPVQTQAVTYIVQRLASLATLFYLLSLVMYIKWRLIKQESGVGTKNPKSEILYPKFGWGSTVWYLTSLISAVLAMKTKEIAFTLPLVIALYEFLFFMGPVKKRVLYLLPLLLTMLIIPLSLMGMTKPMGDIIGDVSEAARVGSTLTQWEYLFTEFRVIVTYIRLLFFPVNQNLDYDYPVYHSFFDAPVVLSFLFLSALFGTAVYLLYRSRLNISANKSPCPPFTKGGQGGITPPKPPALNPMPIAIYFRLIAFGIFWFFITLSVESSVIPIADVIFEHRLYLPSVGFFITAVGVLSMVWQRVNIRTTNIEKIQPNLPLPKGVTSPFLEKGGKGRFSGKCSSTDNPPENEVWKQPAKIVVAVCGLIIVIFSGATYFRNNIWRTEVMLWEDVARKSPMKARSYNGLGLAYQKEGRIDEAIESLARAVAINPSYAVAYNSLGSAYFRKNLFVRAVEEFSRAIALEPGNAIFRNNRGLAYAALGETDRAIADYLEALTLEFAYAEAYHNLGSALHGKGLYEKAVEEYTKAITLEADNAIYYNNRGLSYAALREFERAIADYMKAIAFKPDFAEAYVGKGVANGELRRFDAAVGDFTRAISLNPSKASSYVNRAVAYEQMQNIGMAMSDFQRACEMGDERGCSGVEYMRKKYQAGK